MIVFGRIHILEDEETILSDTNADKYGICNGKGECRTHILQCNTVKLEGEGIIRLEKATRMAHEAGLEVINDGKRSQWVPDEQELQSLRQYGREFAGQL